MWTILQTLFKIYIITWNVGEKFPDKISLNDLLGLNETAQSNTNLPDFFVIGLQEVNAKAESTVHNLFNDDPWTDKLQEVLKPHDYVLIKTKQMQGLLLSVFSLRTHLLHLRQIEAENVRTGLGGLWGNKGAVTIRLDVYGNSLCLVNAHLAAHDHMLERRIEDYEKIVEKNKFHVKSNEAIFDHDYVLWFGDLNFRLTGSDSPEEVRDMVNNDKLQQLIERDQLVKIRRQGRAFHQLTEQLPTFPPTFKFRQGTDSYDMQRRPAWCDRILYAKHFTKEDELQIQPNKYRSHPDYKISDHKPVSGEFELEIQDNPSQQTVAFDEVKQLCEGDLRKITYTLPAGFEEGIADYIGIYPEDFTSLREHLAYQFTPNANKDDRMKNVWNNRTVEMEILWFADMQLGRRYQLLYFQSTGKGGVTSMVGMSNKFAAEKVCQLPGIEDID